MQNTAIEKTILKLLQAVQYLEDMASVSPTRRVAAAKSLAKLCNHVSYDGFELRINCDDLIATAVEETEES
jgi:hypothetical protein